MIPASDTNRRPRMLEGGRRVYIAGPMRGIRMHNFPAFDRAARVLRRTLGVVPVNPADLDRRNFGYDGSYVLPTETVSEMLQRDLRELGECDAVVLLPGWRKSAGVAMELDMARLKNIPVWRLIAGRFLVPLRAA